MSWSERSSTGLVALPTAGLTFPLIARLQPGMNEVAKNRLPFVGLPEKLVDHGSDSIKTLGVARAEPAAINAATNINLNRIRIVALLKPAQQWREIEINYAENGQKSKSRGRAD